jgi:hypothetical protein
MALLVWLALRETVLEIPIADQASAKSMRHSTRRSDAAEVPACLSTWLR